MNRYISVTLTEDQIKFAMGALAEMYGGSAQVFLKIINRPEEDLKSARQELESAFLQSNTHINMPESSWRAVYEAINAAIYSLGPFELSTITGYNLAEAAEVNLKICSSVWGAYGAASWLEKGNTKNTEQVSGGIG
jgi:hypothetical protein